MTLESILQQWADAIVNTCGASIPSSIAAAKRPSMQGYIMCDLNQVSAPSAEYPFKLKVVAADGSPYTIDMSTDDYDCSICNERCYPNVPLNNTLLKHFIASDWILGSAAEFEATRSSQVVW